MQAEDALEPRDLLEATIDGARGGGAIGMGELQARLGAERRRHATGKSANRTACCEPAGATISPAAPAITESARRRLTDATPRLRSGLTAGPPRLGSSDTGGLPLRISVRFSRRLRRSIIGGQT